MNRHANYNHISVEATEYHVVSEQTKSCTMAQAIEVGFFA